jgi:hypothetical protein
MNKGVSLKLLFLFLFLFHQSVNLFFQELSVGTLSKSIGKLVTGSNSSEVLYHQFFILENIELLSILSLPGLNLLLLGTSLSVEEFHRKGKLTLNGNELISSQK